MTAVFADLAAGDAIPSLSLIVTREDVRAYAAAGGDPNPLHQDEAVARAAGFPGIIAHGMFTMGHLASCVTGWGGEAAEVTRISAQFRAPVFLGEEIVAGGRVRSLNPSTRSVTLDLWVTLERGGVTEYPIRKGEAEVRLPA